MTKEKAIYILRNTAFLAPSLEPIDEAIEMACEALRKTEQTEPQAKLCRECDDYAGNGMYCASNHIVYDFSTSRGNCEPQTEVTTDCRQMKGADDERDNSQTDK